MALDQRGNRCVCRNFFERGLRLLQRVHGVGTEAADQIAGRDSRIGSGAVGVDAFDENGACFRARIRRGAHIRRSAHIRRGA